MKQEDMILKKLLILCLLIFSSFSVVACGSETKSEQAAAPMKPATAVFETSMGDFSHHSGPAGHPGPADRQDRAGPLNTTKRQAPGRL